MRTKSRLRYGARSLSRLLLSLVFASATFALAPSADAGLASGGTTLIERCTPLPPGPIESSLAVDEGTDENRILATIPAGVATFLLGNPGFHRHPDRDLRPAFSIVPSGPPRAPPLA